jgi:hypothetical protein
MMAGNQLQLFTETPVDLQAHEAQTNLNRNVEIANTLWQRELRSTVIHEASG